MNVKYCPHTNCGAKTEYVAKIPRFCASCGASFTSAFLTASVPLAAPIVQPTLSAPKLVVARVLPSDGFTPRANLTRRPTQDADGQPDEEGLDEFDKETVQQVGRQMAASISARDFGLTLISTAAAPVTLGDVLKNPEKYSDAGTRQPDYKPKTFD